MRLIFLIVLAFLQISCGYPDIDSVPKFNNLLSTDQEILEYCSNINSSKKNIDICVNDYNSKK